MDVDDPVMLRIENWSAGETIRVEGRPSFVSELLGTLTPVKGEKKDNLTRVDELRICTTVRTQVQVHITTRLDLRPVDVVSNTFFSIVELLYMQTHVFPQ